jgi:hypothetical protein
MELRSGMIILIMMATKTTETRRSRRMTAPKPRIMGRWEHGGEEDSKETKQDDDDDLPRPKSSPARGNNNNNSNSNSNTIKKLDSPTLHAIKTYLTHRPYLWKDTLDEEAVSNVFRSKPAGMPRDERGTVTICHWGTTTTIWVQQQRGRDEKPFTIACTGRKKRTLWPPSFLAASSLRPNCSQDPAPHPPKNHNNNNNYRIPPIPIWSWINEPSIG